MTTTAANIALTVKSEDRDNVAQAAAVAQLRKINLAALKRQCPDEMNNLVAAAQQDGVFYLDLSGTMQSNMTSIANDINKLSQSIFDLDYEEKMLYDVDTLGDFKLNGYKPLGRNIGGIKGQRDGFESYAISRDVISSFTDCQIPQPTVTNSYKKSLVEFTNGCLDAADVIFKTLSTVFDLPVDKSFASCHNSSQSTLDILRLLRYPGAIGNESFSIPQAAHTDMGSLTFLFTAYPGLQILPSGCSKWLNVMPKPGLPVVNFGDAMKILSNGRFESVLHRVASTSGKQVQDRYSFAFLMRPEPSTSMSPLPRFKSDEGGCEEAPTCEEWVSRKFKMLRGA